MHSTYTFNTIPLLHDGEKAFLIQNAYEKSYTFYLCIFLYLVYEPRMFKGISKTAKKNKIGIHKEQQLDGTLQSRS